MREGLYLSAHVSFWQTFVSGQHTCDRWASELSGTPPLQRVEFIDYAKGWCIVLVVLMHSTLGLTERVGEANWLGELIAFARPFRMPDFFLIAGLFAMRSLHAPLRSFLDGKIMHFAYFYVLWMTIQILTKRGGLLIQDPGQFGGEYLYSLVEPLGTLWFIYLLPIMYAAARLCARSQRF